MKAVCTALAGTFFTTIVAAGALEGQAPVPTTQISDPAATFPEPFSSITGLRELSDGRLVISDRLEQAVRIVDLKAGTMEEIGRIGQGPGEYQMPGDLFALPGDSTLLLDFANRRLTVIDPAGRLVRSMPLRHSSGAIVRPGGTDARGRIYFDQMGMVQVEEGPGGRATDIQDTAPLLRWDPATDAIDTLAALARPAPGAMRAAVGRGGFGAVAASTAFAPRDAWAVALDGRVAVVRAEPEYRIEWLSPAGAKRTGPAVAYEPVPLTRADQEEWAERLAATAVVAIESVENGRRSSRTMNVPRPNVDELEFPETKPPFPAEAAATTPDGELWVERNVPFGQPQTFDVFDAAGRRVRQVRLPEGRRLVAFGDGVLYAVRSDESDLQWLERYERG